MKVLMALDDSDQAQTVVDELTPWLRRSEAEVHLISVIDLSHVKAAMRAGESEQDAVPADSVGAPVTQPPPHAAETHGQALSRLRSEREDALLHLVSTSMEGVNVEVHAVADDHTADAIANHAAEVNADLIAVGTHGRSGLRRALMGSIAERIIQRADRPVLVIPEGATKTWGD